MDILGNVLCLLEYTEKKICLNLFGTRKFVLILQPKRIFLSNKEKYVWIKCLLLYFKIPFLKSKDSVLWFKYDLNCRYFSLRCKTNTNFSWCTFDSLTNCIYLTQYASFKSWPNKRSFLSSRMSLLSFLGSRLMHITDNSDTPSWGNHLRPRDRVRVLLQRCDILFALSFALRYPLCWVFWSEISSLLWDILFPLYFTLLSLLCLFAPQSTNWSPHHGCIGWFSIRGLFTLYNTWNRGVHFLDAQEWISY